MFLSRRYWLTLKPDTRKELAKRLGIPRSGGTAVEDNKVVSDGYTDNDLATLTLEMLQKECNADDDVTDFYELLEYIIDAIENRFEEENATQSDLPSLLTNTVSTGYTEVSEETVSVSDPNVVVDKEPATLYPKPEDQKVKILVDEKPKNKGGRPKGSKTKKVNKPKK